MKKNILFSMLLLLLVTIGCSKKEEKAKVIEEKKFDKLSGFVQIKLNCDAIKNLVDVSHYDNLFITNDGKLYRISYEKLFSNDTNCMQVDSDKTFTRFIRGGIIDSDNNVYYYDNENNKIKKNNFENGSITMPYGIKDISKSKYKNIIASDLDFAYGDNQMFYFYYDDLKKEIYNYINDTSKLSNKALLKLDEDEVLEYITYGGIKTNKSFYVYGREASNREECEKYEDVKCIYKNGFYKVNNSDIYNQLEHIKFIQVENIDTYTTYYILDENNNFYSNVLGG